ncbi:hypothetical protein T265_03238 [Opisthorchis viverrini]|uniref:Uncharacterized protein n=1 Tax=Opisthorchis viverrini TaxID=6198 RepID=A0A074ZS87_OPIVI|nr:hypothetical protein T265_03238 [Opisthorchis viverrini]KER30288.1 hypothetical protein T265_03238 [Opisthorchis viverrini]
MPYFLRPRAKPVPYSQHTVGKERMNEAWSQIKGAMQAEIKAVCPASPIHSTDDWISSRSLVLTGARRPIPIRNQNDCACKSLEHEMVNSLWEN